MPRVDDRKSRLAFEERQLREERTEHLPYFFRFLPARVDRVRPPVDHWQHESFLN